MIDEIGAVARALGRTVPPDLVAMVIELQRTPWTEISTRWSRLTPTGSPIELTVGNCDARDSLAWSCEIAGPEVADEDRLGRVATTLALADQPVPVPILEALRRTQCRGELRYGAWLGGRSAEDRRTGFKLYGEVPSGVPLTSLPVPERLRDAVARVPAGTVCRMIGVEPARERVELYFRLPVVAADDLRPLTFAAGQPHALEALQAVLPDGLRRLAGRRLGISVAAERTGALELALFASARTMFPGAPEMLHRLIAAIAQVPRTLARPTLVTMRVDPSAEGVSFATGLTLVTARQG